MGGSPPLPPTGMYVPITMWAMWRVLSLFSISLRNFEIFNF
jgi:hypothetical protein